MNQVNRKLFSLVFFLSGFLGSLLIISTVFAANINVTAVVPFNGPVCGNTVIESPEQCEGSIGCSAGYHCESCTCVPNTGCTSGALVCSWGECIGGTQIGSCSDGCYSSSPTRSCTVAACGDGTLDAGEECDDSNIISGDGCSATCQIEVGCGNGILNAGEECDDNNLVSGDCCSAECKIELIISNVSALPQLNSAVIGWDTLCQDTSSILEWGKTISVDEAAANLTGKNYSHEITGLQNATTYYFKITASAGALQTTQTGSFITLGATEICNNGLDDDSDGLIDTADFDCPCEPDYSCTEWSPEPCPANGIQTRTCTKTNICWKNQPTPAVSRSCSPLSGCELSCGFCQNLDINQCTCNPIAPCCGNGICETPTEDPTNCPNDCQVACISDWQCTEWSPLECPASGIQTRECFDKNACPIPINPPDLQQSCGGQCPGLSCGTCQNININSCSCEEFSPCCGNSICEIGETHESCPADCVQICQPKWNCSDWGECQDGLQKRKCEDENNCQMDLGRPPEVISCELNCSLACGVCQQASLSTCQCLSTIPCCGNRICEQDETTWSCPVDCGLPPTLKTNLPECLDGKDNDKNGLIDYPADPGCSGPYDNSELSIAKIIQKVTEQAKAVNESVAAPVLVTTVIVNTATSFSFFNFFTWLQYIFSQPLAALFRRRRAKWGIVYNSLTKQPIDLAIVRLYRKSDNRLVQSRVTDKLGRFLIMADIGDYYLTVIKPNFVFPTAYLKDENEDVKYLDLYHGETVNVKENQASISVNIPLDPIEKAIPDKKIIFRYYLRKVQYALAFSAVPLAFLSVLISPSWLTITFLVIHIILYYFFRRLGYQKAPKSWGMVYDKHTRKPLAHAITRIYDKKYNKLLETRITDSKGRYSFLVGNNIYFLTSEKAGYDVHKTEDIDLLNKNRDAIVDFDIGLKKSSDQTKEILPSNESITPVNSENNQKINQVAEKNILSTPELLSVNRDDLTEIMNAKNIQKEKEINEQKELIENQFKDQTSQEANNQSQKPKPEKSIFG